MGLDDIPGGATWTATGGLSNTYQTTVSHTWSEIANRGYPILVDNVSRMTMIDWGFGTIGGVTNLATAQAYVDAHPGTFTVSGPGTYTGGYTTGSYTYYVHPADGTNPGSNGRIYRFGQRQFPQLGSSNLLENAICIGGVQHDGVVAYACRLRNVSLYWPGAHAGEFPGCHTENLYIDGSNFYVPTGYAYHHFGSTAFVKALHRNARCVNFTGPFNAVIGIHGGTGFVGTLGNIVAFDGLECSNVNQLCGAEAHCNLVHVKGLVARDMCALGQPGVNYYLERPQVQFSGTGSQSGAISPPQFSGLTLTIDDGQFVVENQLVAILSAAGGAAGALTMNRCKTVQKYNNVNLRWLQLSNAVDGITFNDCIFAALVSPTANFGNPVLGASFSGGASASMVAANSSNFWNINILAQASWATSFLADPKFNRIDDTGVGIDLVNSPYNWRRMLSQGLAATPPGSFMAGPYIVNLDSTNLSHIQYSSQTTAACVSGTYNNLRWLRDGSGNQYLAAFGNGGVLSRTASGGLAMSTGVATGLTKNFTGMAANCAASAYPAFLCCDDGSVYQYQPSTDTFTLNTTGSAALYGACCTAGSGSSIHCLVGNGLIMVSTNGGTSWSTPTAPTGILRAVAGYGANLVAVGDDGLIAYSTNSGTSWTAIHIEEFIDFKDVAVSSAGVFLAVGKPRFGRCAAYQANTTAGLGTWTQVSTPLDNISYATWMSGLNLGTNHTAAPLWVVTGPVARMWMSQDLTTWWPDMPNPPAYAVPARTYLEDDVATALLANL